ncbi:MAG: RDD family protein [Janthinobacterium lividum]
MSDSMALPPAFRPGPSLASTPGLVWNYAGFWWRLLAWMVDCLVLSAAEYALGIATGLRQVGLTTNNDDQSARQISDIAYSTSFSYPASGWHLHGGGLSALGLVLTIGYFVLMESSHWQATLGKRVCKLRVTDIDGRRIGIPRALGRYLGKFVSAFILGIGFLMVGWTRRKQGLHDLMADTLVMRLRPNDVFTFQPPPMP